MTLVLHDYELDDGCYRIRLLLSMLRLDWTKVPVDVHPRREHLNAVYRQLNPRLGLPILVDEGLVVGDTCAILAYLARAYDPSGLWLPEAPRIFAAVLAWAGFADKELAAASRARLHDMLEAPADGPAEVAAAKRAFRIMDDHMTRREFDEGRWFVGPHATIADVALFPAIALSRDFSLDHDDFPALRRWMRRFRQLPGFLSMPGIPDYY